MTDIMLQVKIYYTLFMLIWNIKKQLKCFIKKIMWILSFLRFLLIIMKTFHHQSMVLVILVPFSTQKSKRNKSKKIHQSTRYAKKQKLPETVRLCLHTDRERGKNMCRDCINSTENDLTKLSKLSNHIIR